MSAQQTSNNQSFLSILDNVTVLAWFKQQSKSEVMWIISLLSDNFKNFQKLYGDPIQDSQNPNVYLWNISYQSIPYMLVCNQETGQTLYYVQYSPTINGIQFKDDAEFGTYIISYLTYLVENKLMFNMS